MTITDLIEKLENIQDKIDVDADPDVFLNIGGQEVALMILHTMLKRRLIMNVLYCHKRD